MTVTITGTVVDATSRKDSRGWRVWSPVYRQGTNGEIITVTEQPVRVHAGLFTAELEPGVAVIQSPDGDQWTVTIPDTDGDLWELIEQAIGVPPGTPQDQLAAAVESFVSNNPGYPWSGIAEKPAVIAAGDTGAVARAAIGATTVGGDLFTTGSASAARTTLGAGVCAHMTALKAIGSVSAALGASDGHVRVLGYATPGDGGGGVFRWDSSDTTTPDNGGTVIAPTSGPSGRWKRVYEGEVNARWFGMHPSKTDNTAALQAAVDWVSQDQTRNPAGNYGAGTVFIPMGYYRFTFDQGTSGLSTITISSSYVTIRGEGSATTLTVRSHTRPSQLNYFFTFDASYKALGGGVKDLCIDGASMLKWGIYLDTWHGAEFSNIYMTDLHGGLIDAYSTLSPNCGESISIRHVEYQCTSGSNSCFTQYGIRFRSSSGASWSDCWIQDCNFIGIWDSGIVLDGVIRFSVKNIGVSSNYATTNTLDGTSKGGVMHTVKITHTVDGSWSSGNGQHIVDGLYHESHEGNETVTDFAAVLIEAPVGGGGYNRYNRVSNVDTSWNTTPAPALFRATADYGDNRVMDNTFIGSRRAITVDGQIYVGPNVRNTQLYLTPSLGGLASVFDLGSRTRVNGQAFSAYRNSALWPDNKRSQSEYDVGEISRDPLTGRVILQDKNNDPVLIGPRPGVDVVSPYGAQRIQAMPTPDAPTVFPLGSGSTTWTYYVVAIDKDGNKSVPSAAGTTTIGPATLTSSTYNAVQWWPVPGAVKYDLLRGDTGHSVATNLVATHYNDSAASTSVYTPSASNPAGTLTVDGTLTVGSTNAMGPENAGLQWYPNNYISGNYYACNSTQVVGTSGALGNGTLRLTPWVVTKTVSITKLWCEHTVAGEAGSVFRIGIYSHDSTTGKPVTLVLDAGTVATDVAAAVQEVTVSLTLTPGLYWVGGAVQSAATTQPTMRVGQVYLLPNMIPYGTSLPAAGTALSSYSKSSVTGALPSTLTGLTASGSAAIPRVGFKVA